MKKKLVALSVLGLLLGTSNVSAQNDVVVDLSVLENLQRNSYEGLSTVNVPQPEVQTTVVETVSLADGSGKSVSNLLNLPPLQPKFPVVKAQPKKKVVAQKAKTPKKKAEKKVAKKAENPFTENEVVECQKYLAEKTKPVSELVSTVGASSKEDSAPKLETPVNLVSESSSSDVDRIIREYEESKKLENSVSDVDLQNNLALQEEQISESDDVSLKGLTAPAQTLAEPETTSDALPPVLEKALAEPEVSNVDLAPVSSEALAEPEKTSEVLPSETDKVLSEPEATTEEVVPVSPEVLTEPEKVEAAPTSVEDEIKEALAAPLSENTPDEAANLLTETANVTEEQVFQGPQNLVNVQEKAEAQVAEASRQAEENFPELSSQDLSKVAAPEAAQQEVSSDLIKFEEGVTTLTEADKLKIDSIVNKFEDARANKIGIMAFNLDNGQDTFKRKRECLSRATEIRSYLLSKGYKEFKIKVINIDEKSEKTNAVELVELK